MDLIAVMNATRDTVLLGLAGLGTITAGAFIHHWKEACRDERNDPAMRGTICGCCGGASTEVSPFHCPQSSDGKHHFGLRLDGWNRGR